MAMVLLVLKLTALFLVGIFSLARFVLGLVWDAFCLVVEGFAGLIAWAWFKFKSRKGQVQ